MMESSSLQELEKLTRHPWRIIYTQGGILKDSENPSFHSCCAASLVVLSEHALWVFVEDTGKYKEVALGLRVSVNDGFGKEGHESIFRPSLLEVKDFPESCRLDRFLNEKPSMISKIKSGEGGQLLEGLVLGNSKGNRLGIFVDEDIPGNLLLTTDVETIDALCRKSTS